MKTHTLSKELFVSNEIEIHYKRPLFHTMTHITCADDVNQLIREYITSSQMDLKEFFWVVLLNNANCVLGISQISMGSSSSVSVSVKEICQLAITTSSSFVIVLHNHPSGLLNPSKADQKITTKIKKALALFDVKLLDHLIISSESFYSFANQGTL